MSGKKILFVLPWLSIGGLERLQVTLANALSKMGNDVTVMTLQPGDELKSELSPQVNFVFKKLKEHPIMRRIPYVRHKFYDDGMWETRATAQKLYRYYIGNEIYDVEIGFFRGLATKIISGSTNPKSIKIAWVHSDFKLCSGYMNNFRNLKELQQAYLRYNHIITVSNQAGESFADVIGLENKTTTIYNLLPIKEILEKSRFVAPMTKNKFTIVTVGHLVNEKGYDRLLEAVRRLNDTVMQFDLWIVGDGKEADSLQAYANEHKIDNVRFLGKQLNPYVYMKQADLYVCSSRYEGYNLTVAEALLLGVPVLSTDCTGPNEILDKGKYGRIVENNEDGLYEGIKEMLENPDLLMEYREGAIKRRSFFDEELILRKITNLFDETEQENYG